MKILGKIYSVAFALLTASLPGCKKESVIRVYAKPESTIQANDPRLNTPILHFSKDTVYILATNLNRYRGQTLVVDAGTLVKVNDGLAITINIGARIEADGTAKDPIVFTSSAPKGAPGFVSYQQNGAEHSWFGIAIHGNYPDPIDSTSSGTGVLRYVRIEFAGSSKNNYFGLPSLLLDNVGRGAVMENVEASYSVKYTSFTISGGNVNARDLVSYAAGGTDFSITNGYRGMLQNVLAYKHPYFSPAPSNGQSNSTPFAGLLISGDSTFPAISNLTVIGPDLQPGTSEKYSDTSSFDGYGNQTGSDVSSLIVNGGQFHIRNSVLMGFPKGGFYINNKNSAVSLQYGSSEFTWNILHSNDSSRAFHLRSGIYPGYTSDDMQAFLLRPVYGNQKYLQSSLFMLTDPYAYDTHPNPLPKIGSPVLSGANFDGSVFGNPFFEKVSYLGALGTANWLQGWTNFIPLQTNYNN